MGKTTRRNPGLQPSVRGITLKRRELTSLQEQEVAALIAHTKSSQKRGAWGFHLLIYLPVQSPASGTKTSQVKKPQAKCLDRREVTKDQSGLGSRFSFTTSSKLWQCQKEKNEGSEENCLPLP